MQQEDLNSLADEHQEAETETATETDDEGHFEKSLKELRDLRSYLHHAANYCEASFLNAKHKRAVVNNTKEYICRAVVTVVDHLGTVSANLECQLLKTNSVSETELRIDNLKQRLGTCQYYSYLLARRTSFWSADFPRNHPRYLLQPIQEDPQMTNSSAPTNPMTANKTTHFETEEEVPLFLYSTFDNNSLGRRKSFSKSVRPVRDGMSILPLKDQHPNFQFLESPKLKRGILNWKLAQNKDLRSLIRRGKRTL